MKIKILRKGAKPQAKVQSQSSSTEKIVSGWVADFQNRKAKEQIDSRKFWGLSK